MLHDESEVVLSSNYLFVFLWFAKQMAYLKVHRTLICMVLYICQIYMVFHVCQIHTVLYVLSNEIVLHVCHIYIIVHECQMNIWYRIHILEYSYQFR